MKDSIRSFSETVKYQISYKAFKKIGITSVLMLVAITILYFIFSVITLERKVGFILNQYLAEQTFIGSVSDDLNSKVTKLCNNFDCISLFILDTKTNRTKISYPSKIDSTSSIFLKNTSSRMWIGSLLILSPNQYLFKYSKADTSIYMIIGIKKYFFIILTLAFILSIVAVVFYLTVYSSAKEVSKLLDNEINKLILLTKDVRNQGSPETKEIIFLYDHILKQAKLAAIGQTTGMLAHDLRKPFSQIKGLLSFLYQIKDNPKLIDLSIKEIDVSVKHVEGMLSEIMDFSKEINLKIEPISIIKIIDYAIRHASEINLLKKIDLVYNIKNSNMLLVDIDKFSRAIINILLNAIEALTLQNQKNENKIIEISTKNICINKINCVEITIGNNGPLIDKDDIPKVFDSFFTKGKNRGTGLGLASAKKIITLHTGTIEVFNNIEKSMVEFKIIIPSSNKPETHKSETLPKTIGESTPVKSSEGQKQIQKFINLFVQKKLNFSILLLEDEPLYRASVKNTIKQSSALSSLITLYDATSYDEAVALVSHENITHAIVDIDLKEDKNGFDFMEYVKSKNINCMVHSNRHLDEYQKKSFDLNAKAFVPKPLNLEQLVLFLSNQTKIQD